MLKTESKLEVVLAAGHFAVTAEIGPQSHVDGKLLKKHGRTLQGYVDACQVTDNRGAAVQLASMAAGALLVQQGQEAIVEMTCRDRNRIALQADLLGAYALGVRNVLCTSGSHSSLGSAPEARNVYDLDTVNLIRSVQQLGEDKELLGERSSLKPRFYVGCSINTGGEPLELQLIQLEKKVEAGADFVQTQAVFDLDKFDEFMETVRQRGLHQKAKIFATVTVVNSTESLDLLPDLDQGSIPENVVERLKQSGDARAEALTICLEKIEHLRNVPGVAGIHITAPNWDEIIPFIVERSGFLPRPQIPSDAKGE